MDGAIVLRCNCAHPWVPPPVPPRSKVPVLAAASFILLVGVVYWGRNMDSRQNSASAHVVGRMQADTSTSTLKEMLKLGKDLGVNEEVSVVQVRSTLGVAATLAFDRPFHPRCVLNRILRTAPARTVSHRR